MKMEEVDEESSCSFPEEVESSSISPSPDESNGEKPEISFFHVQPLSLSEGFEPTGSSPSTLPEKAWENITAKWEQHNFARKACRRKRYRDYCLGYRKQLLDERRLCQAVSMNDTAFVSHLLSQGVRADCHDDLLRSPLHIAACKGYTHLVKILLDAGANVNARDPIGNTPLHLAACTNHIDVVMLLLQAGSNGLSVDLLGRSPLQLAQSKLKILQKSSVSDQEVRSQVTQVIELLLMFTRDGPAAEQLSGFRSRLGAAGSRAEVDTELQGLLDSLNTLSISQQT